MAMNYLLADMVSRIRNGQSARLATVRCKYSRYSSDVLDVLKREGYIRDWHKNEEKKGIDVLDVELKYHDGEPVIKEISCVSTPGRREYSSISSLKQFYNGLGTVILSTSKGVLADHEARSQNVGGEVLCKVF